jgi:NADH dehydrogenase
MAFLPFYFPAKTPPKVVIVGGGYAGMAALVTLYRHCPSAEVTLIDPRSDHFKITHLHERFRDPTARIKVPFEVLARRFGFRHVCAAVDFDGETLRRWQIDRHLTIDGQRLPFDYILLATGTKIEKISTSGRVVDLDGLSGEEFHTVVGRLSSLEDGRVPITVAGGGPTGIQFLFEIAHWLKAEKKANPLRLVEASEGVLTQFRPALGKYVKSNMASLGIEFLPNTLFQGQEGEDLLVETKQSGEQIRLASGLTFCFVGKRSSFALETNPSGQVVVGRTLLSHVFAAGDCSDYRSFGSNAKTAQSAVRKGKLCARNILRHSSRLKLLEPYLHQDLGYVVSLGPRDAIGWIGLQANVVGGTPAVAVKELVEAQHELLLAGIDTYLI